LILGLALISTENPNFEITSKSFKKGDMKNEKEKFNYHYDRIDFYADFRFAFSLGGKPPAPSMGGRCHRCWHGRCRERAVEQLFVFTPADKGGIPIYESSSSEILLFRTPTSKALGSEKKMGSTSSLQGMASQTLSSFWQIGPIKITA
jgi:hypothetical protein